MSNIQKDILKFEKEEPNTFWQEYGLPPPTFEDERNAPPVDKAVLESLVDKTLPEDQKRDVLRLTLRSRSWSEAAAELFASRLKESVPSAPKLYQGD